MAVDASTPVGSSPVTGAIRKAARATGTSFDYLLATAKVESDLDPNLTMRTSTATGLFQFIDQTWLATLKQAGPAFGYGTYAAAIGRTDAGRYYVDDPALRREILQLRKDPTANAIMGGVFTQQNITVLSNRLGRRPSEAELYVGHFFGPQTGAKAIALAKSNPNLNAAEMFPAAARANQSIFYDKQGEARSIAGVCAELKRRYQVAREETRAPAVAAAGAPLELRPPISVPGAVVAAAESSPLPASAEGANVLVAAQAATFAPLPPVRGDGTGTLFHLLFQPGDRREAIAPAISELWGAPKPLPAEPSSPSADADRDKGAGGRTLDLFRDP
jgi:hypothetical protein